MKRFPRAKAAGMTAIEIPIESVGKVFDKTIGRMGTAVRRAYVDNRAYGFNREVAACKGCQRANKGHQPHFFTGLRNDPNDFCNEHRPLAMKLDAAQVDLANR